jgi:hypothetical protein
MQPIMHELSDWSWICAAYRESKCSGGLQPRIQQQGALRTPQHQVWMLDCEMNSFFDGDSSSKCGKSWGARHQAADAI